MGNACSSTANGLKGDVEDRGEVTQNPDDTSSLTMKASDGEGGTDVVAQTVTGQDTSAAGAEEIRVEANGASKEPITSSAGEKGWTAGAASKLQESVDRIFAKAGAGLLGLEFSLTIADPFLDGCPLIGCSSGFTKLCGYEMSDIVGRNCRFLVDPVPPEQMDKNMRKHVKDFCEAVKLGKEYWRPEAERESWMPQGRPGDELVAMQRNARKDGTLFNNMFYMKVFRVKSEAGEEVPYILAIQSELKEGKADLVKVTKNLADLEAQMAIVNTDLSGLTVETGNKLQESVDRIFGTASSSLLGLEFSLTVADPLLDGCPLIGCSTGFTKLCGYEMCDIVGRNCRFLVNPVPADQIDKYMRKHVKDFCEAVKLGQDYWRPESERESWMPQGRPGDELVAMQRNARKDGTLFNNMFCMKVFHFSSESGKKMPYILAIQSELKEGKADLAKVTENLAELESKMVVVNKELVAMESAASVGLKKASAKKPEPKVSAANKASKTKEPSKAANAPKKSTKQSEKVEA